VRGWHDNVDVVVQVLHVFGSDGGDEVCECGLAYLLATMGPSGSWTKALTALGTQHDNHDADLHAIKVPNTQTVCIL
jgi:hypothetical protein